MRYEDMSVRELEDALARLHGERADLQQHWMADDPDDDWGEVQRETDIVEKLLAARRSQ